MSDRVTIAKPNVAAVPTSTTPTTTSAPSKGLVSPLAGHNLDSAPVLAPSRVASTVIREAVATSGDPMMIGSAELSDASQPERRDGPVTLRAQVPPSMLRRQIQLRAERLARERAAAATRAGATAPGSDERAIHAAAERGVASAGGPLPHGEAIQRSFGRHDISDVRAHIGDAAAEASQAMGAEAFASGNDVAFSRTPSLHTAAHEAAHVVQQRGGVQLKGGVGEKDDAYERHADAVADRVVAGESAEALLDKASPGAGAAHEEAHVPRGGAGGGSPPGARVVQRSWLAHKTYGDGTFGHFWYQHTWDTERRANGWYRDRIPPDVKRKLPGPVFSGPARPYIRDDLRAPTESAGHAFGGPAGALRLAPESLALLRHAIPGNAFSAIVHVRTRTIHLYPLRGEDVSPTRLLDAEQHKALQAASEAIEEAASSGDGKEEEEVSSIDRLLFNSESYGNRDYLHRQSHLREERPRRGSFDVSRPINSIQHSDPKYSDRVSHEQLALLQNPHTPTGFGEIKGDTEGEEEVYSRYIGFTVWLEPSGRFRVVATSRALNKDKFGEGGRMSTAWANAIVAALGNVNLTIYSLDDLALPKRRPPKPEP
jgi:hypothetical protein